MTIFDQAVYNVGCRGMHSGSGLPGSTRPSQPLNSCPSLAVRSGPKTQPGHDKVALHQSCALAVDVRGGRTCSGPTWN